uniref:Uncharacterized protein n=1 Tax=Arundo donax TaxID=35708 RepID=A0A0A8ZKW4_ARUDO
MMRRRPRPVCLAHPPFPRSYARRPSSPCPRACRRHGVHRPRHRAVPCLPGL